MKRVHFWTNAMGGIAYIPGTNLPVASCDHVLCGAVLADGEVFLDGFGNHSLNPDEATCPDCRYLLDTKENAHRWPRSKRRSVLRNRPKDLLVDG